VSRQQKIERRSPSTARFLLIITILYNAVEGVVAIGAGAAAGSLALVAFGADSYLEVGAAAAVLWRVNITDSERGEAAERRAMRLIGWTFLALSAVIASQAVSALASSDGAEESLIGIGLALVSVTVMPAVALWKLKVAADGRLLALAAEAKETIACSYLSLTLLAGLVANCCSAGGGWTRPPRCSWYPGSCARDWRESVATRASRGSPPASAALACTACGSARQYAVPGRYLAEANC
jgi:divalent metal cation (Fe/Co/Zn/Cd) transporter